MSTPDHIKHNQMKITMASTISGKETTMDIDITPEQYTRILNRRENGELIQKIVPHLSPDIREFLISGISSQEWDEVFGDPNDIEEAAPDGDIQFPAF